MINIFKIMQDYEKFYDKENITLQVFMNKPFDGVCTYASVDTFHKNIGKELLMLFKNDIDINLYGNIFAIVANYFQKNLEINYLGGHTMSLGPIISNSKITAFYLSIPYSFDDENVWEKYFWVVPITDKELQFLHKNGLEALEDHFENKSINLTNLMREDSFS